MSNRGALAGNLNEIVFRSAANSSIAGKFMSLFPGLGYAAGYKVAQRVYKFGGQPYFRDLIDSNFGSTFRTAFGNKTGGLLMHAAAGSLTGIGEVVLLPLDVLKIKMQTNPGAIQGRNFFRLLSDEGVASLYRGWGWTMARNAPGSFALFGGSAFAKEYLFKLQDYSSATWSQSESSGFSVITHTHTQTSSLPLPVPLPPSPSPRPSTSSRPVSRTPTSAPPSAALPSSRRWSRTRASALSSRVSPPRSSLSAPSSSSPTLLPRA